MQIMKQLLTDFSARIRKPLFGFSAFALLVAAFAFMKFTIHILTGQNYGYFGDEFYAIAASKHLAFGYVDLPPLTPFLVAISRALFGESLLAYHIFPALAGSATLVFVCLITREFGGRLFATALSALGFLIAPMWLITNSFFCYDGINQLVLAVLLYFLVRYICTGNKKLWISIGLAAGIAFMTKATILISAPGLFIALLASKHRRDLLTPWPWIAVGLFAIVISPWVFWEIANHWPTLEYWSGHTRWFYHYSVPQYFINMSLMMNPVLMPLLGVGLYRIFRRFAETSYSFFGIVFLVTMVVVYLFHGRIFELGHLFVPLLAASAVFIEEKLAHIGLRRAFETVCVSFLLAGGIVEAPLCLPVLPLDKLPEYSSAMWFLFRPVRDYNFERSPYPQEFAMRIGWEELVQKVAEV
jgi:4-amino-4-deoxy-L-arabinose transferase-like glycosyltransferase